MATATATASRTLARQAGFFSDLRAVAIRALRGVSRDIEMVVPSLFIPVFFFLVNVGALQDFAENIPGLDYKAFQLPVAIVFAITGVSRAITVVTDIQNGYFDRLSLTPSNRLALLLGFMIADLTLVIGLTIPVLIMGFIVGVRFETGFLGVLAFLGLAGAWGLAFTGFGYAIALKTGNPTIVNMSWLIFFPFTFLTTLFLPKEALTGWMATVATYNPVTYLLEGLRSIVSEGWQWGDIGKASMAIGGVAFVSIGLALLALRGRVQRR
jgi:ABC-2 type transport system permease protein